MLLLHIARPNAVIINPSKCNIVVFSGGGAWPGKEWTVDGQVVARVQEFRHLGIVVLCLDAAG